jgi:hypothetical protein
MDYASRNTPPPASYWPRRLVRCVEHGESCCWVQQTGEHISCRVCICWRESPALCPIDAHAVPWLLANPDFHEDSPRKTCRPVGRRNHRVSQHGVR